LRTLRTQHARTTSFAFWLVSPSRTAVYHSVPTHHHTRTPRTSTHGPRFTGYWPSIPLTPRLPHHTRFFGFTPTLVCHTLRHYWFLVLTFRFLTGLFLRFTCHAHGWLPAFVRLTVWTFPLRTHTPHARSYLGSAPLNTRTLSAGCTTHGAISPRTTPRDSSVTPLPSFSHDTVSHTPRTTRIFAWFGLPFWFTTGFCRISDMLHCIFMPVYAIFTLFAACARFLRAPRYALPVARTEPCRFTARSRAAAGLPFQFTTHLSAHAYHLSPHRHCTFPAVCRHDFLLCTPTALRCRTPRVPFSWTFSLLPHGFTTFHVCPFPFLPIHVYAVVGHSLLPHYHRTFRSPHAYVH